MKLGIFIFLTIFGFSTAANAANFEVITALSANSSEVNISNKFAESMKPDNVKFRSTDGNCALLKSLWDSRAEPTLMIVVTNSLGTTDKDNRACFIETKRENFFAPILYGKAQFCSAGNKTWEDFTRKGSTHVVSIHPNANSEKLFRELGEKYGVTFKTVRVQGSAQARTMARAGEIDAVFRVGSSNFPEYAGRCFWDHTQIEKYFQLKDENYRKLGEYVVVMHKNLTSEQLIRARSLWYDAWKSEQQIRLGRGYRDEDVEWKTPDGLNRAIDTFLSIY